MRSHKFLGIALIIGCVVLVALSITNNNAERYRSSTSFSRMPVGLSTFVSLAKAVAPDRIIQRRAALLTDDDLKEAGVFLTFSPKSPFSRREATLVKTFAEHGGRVVIGVQSPESIANLDELLDSLDVKLTPTEIPDFKNRITTSILAPSTATFIPSNHTYEFYSRFAAEKDNPGSLFVEKPLGKGSVTVFMGVPPIANALVGRAENWRIAHALLAQGGAIVLDEYHHLFSDRTVGDLVLEPSFALPIFGMILVGIIFFLFGRLSKHDAWERPPTPPQARSFHHFGVSLFQGLVKRSKIEDQAVNEHAEFLKNLFPGEVGRIDAGANPKGAWLERGAQLVQVHKGLLRERGWKL
jgi:hypothetical protein